MLRKWPGDLGGGLWLTFTFPAGTALMQAPVSSSHHLHSGERGDTGFCPHDFHGPEQAEG